MRSLLIALALFAGQAITLQQKPVVHLKPHSDAIDPAFGGALLELTNAPATVHLPPSPPNGDASGNPWTIDVKNFGPAAISVVDKQGFSASLQVGQTVHILAHGKSYILKY